MLRAKNQTEDRYHVFDRVNPQSRGQRLLDLDLTIIHCDQSIAAVIDRCHDRNSNWLLNEYEYPDLRFNLNAPADMSFRASISTYDLVWMHWHIYMIVLIFLDARVNIGYFDDTGLIPVSCEARERKKHNYPSRVWSIFLSYEFTR